MTGMPFDFSAFGAVTAESPGLAETRNLAVSLMADHGLSDWTFDFDQARTRAGLCDHGTTTITLSAHLMPLWTEAQRKDTILHEIAHALAGPEAGHGPEWQAVCRRIGANPNRTWGHDGEALAEPRWQGTCLRTCPNEHRHGRERDPKARQYVCRTCRSLITWTRNPAR